MSAMVKITRSVKHKARRSASGMSRRPAIAALFSDASGLHQKRQLKQVEALYEKVIGAQRGHFDALHLPGVIAYTHRTRNIYAGNLT